MTSETDLPVTPDQPLQLLFAGTYNRPSVSEGVQQDGIHQLGFDPRTGSLQRLGSTPGIENPSYLCVSKDRTHLYAVWEVGEWPEGLISTFQILDDNGTLQSLAVQGSRGAAPCYLSLTSDAAGKNQGLLVANYVSGTVAHLPLDAHQQAQAASHVIQHEGQGPNVERQEAAHAHCIVQVGTSDHAVAADLGADTVTSYKINQSTGTLRETHSLRMAPGSGPRHIVFHPSGPHAFVVGELDRTITLLGWDAASGQLQPISTVSTHPVGYQGDGDCADVHVHPGGRFVYVSNRGHNSISIFGFDASTESLELIGHRSTGGAWPRNFVLSPDGRFLLVANQHGNNIVCMPIDPETGALGEVAASLDIPAPVCLKFAT